MKNDDVNLTNDELVEKQVGKDETLPESLRHIDTEAACQELLRLLEADDWRITEVARRDGYAIGFTECGMIDYIVECLHSGVPWRPIALGEPPGSWGTAFFTRNAGAHRLYIKLKIEGKYVIILSFKR